MNQSWISYFSNLVKQYGGINLAQGIPGFQPPADLLNILSKTSQNPVHQYAPGIGNLKLRNCILDNYKSQINSSEFSLLITNGGTEAIHLLYLTFHKEKTHLKAAAFSPVYESYMHLPRIHKDEFKSISMDNEDGNLDQRIITFFKNYKPDVFFVNSPGNPYGQSLNQNNFDLISDLCEKQNCKLIIDAVYDQLYFDEPPYYPFTKMHKNTFYVNSFSKRYSITGWRIGYLFCHKSQIASILDVHDYTGLSTPSVLQETLAIFLENSPEKETYVTNIRNIIKGNFQSSNKLLTESEFKIPPTTGGYFVWTQLPNIHTDGIEFAQNLYKQRKTAVIPGEHFGKDYKQFIRINIAQPKEELTKGLHNIIEYASSLQ